MKDRKLIFYVKGKDEIIKVEIMKEMYKGFMCLIQVMICDKKLGVAKQFHTVPDGTCKKNYYFKQCSLSSNFYEEKVVLNIISILSKSPIHPEKTQKV